jgi:transmembrane sensor
MDFSEDDTHLHVHLPLPEQALRWWVRSQHGLSVQEQHALSQWQAQSPAHQQAYAAWQADWQALDQLSAPAVQHLRNQLARDLAAEAVRPPQAQTAASLPGHGSHHRSAWAGLRAGWQALPQWLGAASTRWAQGAVAAALVLGTVFGVMEVVGWSPWQSPPQFAQAFAAPQGQQTQVQLPDGSLLRLDTSTQLDVALYAQRREVRLAQGQAMFQVQGDAARPFDVLAGPVRITVVGTRFAVRYTPGMAGYEGVRVAVEEGRVQVAANGAAPVLLTAGQQVVTDAAGTLGPVAAVPPSGIAPWRAHRVSFDDTPLAQALAELGRYGPTGIALQDPQLGALRLTGTFDTRDLGNFVRALPRVLPVRAVACGEGQGDKEATCIEAAELVGAGR